MDKTINVAAFDSQYKVLSDLQGFLENHPNAHLFLSDSKESSKGDTYETNSPLLLDALRRFAKKGTSAFGATSRRKGLYCYGGQST